MSRHLTLLSAALTLTMAGVEVTQPAKGRCARDIQRLRPLIENATLTRHGIGSYFNRRDLSESSRSMGLGDC